LASLSFRSERCSRAREWVSLEIDGELSTLEAAVLEAHLRECPDCQHFRRETTAISDGIRTAPFERVPRPVSLPTRRGRPRLVRQLTTAAAVATVAITLGTTLATSHSSRSRSRGVPLTVGTTATFWAPGTAFFRELPPTHRTRGPI
jgi:predicted anti-sigma-YlaC factor YlaD